MSPTDAIELATLAILALAILILVTGLTVRFALRPLVEAKARMTAGAAPELEQRMSRVEGEVDRISELRESVERLAEELEFQRKLALPPESVPASARPSA